MVTIEINRPELEALIQERLRSGAFQNVEDVLWDALKTKPEAEGLCSQRSDRRKSLAQLFSESPFKGMSMEFERFSDSLPPSKP